MGLVGGGYFVVGRAGPVAGAADAFKPNHKALQIGGKGSLGPQQQQLDVGRCPRRSGAFGVASICRGAERGSDEATRLTAKTAVGAASCGQLPTDISTDIWEVPAVAVSGQARACPEVGQAGTGAPAFRWTGGNLLPECGSWRARALLYV